MPLGLWLLLCFHKNSNWKYYLWKPWSQQNILHAFSNSPIFLEAYREECNETHSSSVEKEHSIPHPGAACIAVPMLTEQNQ